MQDLGRVLAGRMGIFSAGRKHKGLIMSEGGFKNKVWDQGAASSAFVEVGWKDLPRFSDIFAHQFIFFICIFFLKNNEPPLLN